MWKTRRDFETELIARVWQDPAFRARLEKEPKAVIEEMTGEKLPKDLEVHICQETAKSVFLVIPRNPDDELSDDDLGRVAGGIQIDSSELNSYLDNIFTRLD